MAKLESLKLPEHFDLEPELREQLGNRPGHQRCVEGRGELLLVVHEVPKPRVPEREALFFWKREDGRWTQAGGPGISELSDLLGRYERAIDAHEEVIDSAETAGEIFAILRHAGPLARATRNLVQALEQALTAEPDDRDIRNLRDRAREIERAADLLHADARVTLEFWSAEQNEEQARSSERLGKIAYRLNLLAGFFLPLVSIGGLLGMNVDFPYFVRPLFWSVCFGGLLIGGLLLWLVGRQTGETAEYGAHRKILAGMGKVAGALGNKCFGKRSC
jgi:hypothetical protein